MTRANELISYPNLVLTISKFMVNYYNIGAQELNKLNHRELNDMFPFIELSEPADLTKENLVTGDIVLVIDKKGDILGYNNPLRKIEEVIEMPTEVTKVEIFFTVDENIDVLEEVTEETLRSLNIYELEKLLKLCRENQNYKTRRMIQRELYFRPENHSSEIKSKKLEKVRIREIRKEDLR